MRILRFLPVFLVGSLIGLLGACYVFVINGYQTEYVPNSDRWYQLVKEGHLPEPLKLTYSELKSNGHILEVFERSKTQETSQHNFRKSAPTYSMQLALLHTSVNSGFLRFRRNRATTFAFTAQTSQI